MLKRSTIIKHMSEKYHPPQGTEQSFRSIMDEYPAESPNVPNGDQDSAAVKDICVQLDTRSFVFPADIEGAITRAREAGIPLDHIRDAVEKAAAHCMIDQQIDEEYLLHEVSDILEIIPAEWRGSETLKRAAGKRLGIAICTGQNTVAHVQEIIRYFPEFAPRLKTRFRTLALQNLGLHIVSPNPKNSTGSSDYVEGDVRAYMELFGLTEREVQRDIGAIGEWGLGHLEQALREYGFEEGATQLGWSAQSGRREDEMRYIMRDIQEDPAQVVNALRAMRDFHAEKIDDSAFLSRAKEALSGAFVALLNDNCLVMYYADHLAALGMDGKTFGAQPDVREAYLNFVRRKIGEGWMKRNDFDSEFFLAEALGLKKEVEAIVDEMEKKQPLYERDYRYAGHISTMHEMHGTWYAMKGRYYLMDYSMERKQYLIVEGWQDVKTHMELSPDHPAIASFLNVPYDLEARAFITGVEGERIATEILRMKKEDEAIASARTARVHELAQGDAILAEILGWHMEYNRGRISELTIKEGVTLYQVGRNASHDFYAGVKNGQRYHYSYAEGAPIVDPETGEERGYKMDESLREVEDFEGYYGHY